METFPLGPEEGFELVPQDDEELSPEEDLAAAAEAAVEDPFELEDLTEAPVPLGRTWAFDFERGRFLRYGGSPAAVTRESALTVWLLAAAYTAVGAHPIFPEEFGLERPYDPVGELDVTEAKSDLEERLREAWTQHDRVSDVVDLEVSFSPADDVFYIDTVSVILDEDDRVRFGPLVISTVPE